MAQFPYCVADHIQYFNSQASFSRWAPLSKIHEISLNNTFHITLVTYYMSFFFTIFPFHYIMARKLLGRDTFKQSI